MSVYLTAAVNGPWPVVVLELIKNKENHLLTSQVYSDVLNTHSEHLIVA